jgi:RNA polymerase sigma-70 factor (ECF subfamily)
VEPSDEALIAAHRTGDSAAFGELVRRYADSLLGYLVRMIGDRQHAEDVFQETFIRVHAHAGRFCDDGRFKTWLFTIATRRSIDLLRKRGRGLVCISLDDDNGETNLEKELPDSSGDPSFHAERKEVKEKVRAAVESLPGQQRAVLLLTYFHGLSYPEAAVALQCSVGTVKTHMSRALKSLAKKLPGMKGEVL